MARKCSYSKRDLQIAYSKTKSKILNDIELEKITKSMVTKTYAYGEVGKRLKLKDTSTFHKKSYQYYEYLNTWFEGVNQHIEENIKDNEDVKSININISNDNNSISVSHYDGDTIKDLHSKLREKDLLIKHLNNVISEIRMENESLRLQRIRRLHHLDTDKGSDILDESITAEDIKKLYSLISNLYDATFNK